MIGRTRVVLAAVIVLAMVALGLGNPVRVERAANDEALSTSAAVPVQPDGPLTMEGAYPAALARASEWSDQPSLMFASLQTDWPLDEQQPGPPGFPPGGWVRFAFTDGSGAGAGLLSVVIERYSGEVVTADAQPWDPSRTDSLPVGRTAVTSDQAVVIAERERGQAYRLECPVERHEADVTLLRGALAAGAVGTLATTTGTPVMVATPVLVGTPAAAPEPAPIAATWLVTYRQTSQPGLNGLEVEIDATTGEIRTMRERGQGCPGPAG